MAKPVSRRGPTAIIAAPLDLPEAGGSVHARSGSRFPLPPLPYTDADGSAREVAVESGSHTLVNLWATWCVPCRAELAELAARSDDLGAAGVRVLPLAVDGLVEGGGSADAAATLKGWGLPFQGARATAELVRRVEAVRRRCWGVMWPLPVPTSLLLDGGGHLVAFYTGPVDVDTVLEDAGAPATHDASLPFAGLWIERPESLSVMPVALSIMEAGDVGAALAYVRGAGEDIRNHAEFATLMVWIGDTLMKKGDTVAALVAYEDALAADPKNLIVLNNLAWQLAAHPDPSVRDGERALKWALQANQVSGGNNPAVLDTLAAAQAEAGMIAEAIATGDRAVRLAVESGDRALAASIRKALESYRKKLPE